MDLLYVDPVTGDCLSRLKIKDRMIHEYGMSEKEVGAWFTAMLDESGIESDTMDEFYEKLDQIRREKRHDVRN